MLANGAVDFAYHDTYFVVGHFHYVLSIAAAIGAAIFVISLVGAVTQLGIQFSTGIIILLVGISAVNLLFAIMHIVGIEGHPRRVFLSPEIFIALNNFSNLAIIPLIFSFSAVAGMFSPAQTSITTTHRRFSYSCM